MPRLPAHGEGATLPRELADFLVELSIALHKHAIYPPGHPLLGGAIDGFMRRAGLLLTERPAISLGVARQQLVIEGVATDPEHPVLRELAQRLHRHHLGAVTLTRGLERDETADVLRTIAADPDRRGETPLGLGDPERLTRWRHVRLHALAYEQLELVEEAPEVAPAEAASPAAASARTRAMQLWVGLARAALAADDGRRTAGRPADRAAEGAADSADAPVEADPVQVARAIDEHGREVAYDQVIVGYLLQIADELRDTGAGAGHGAAGGVEAAALRKRISKLVGALSPETLRRLLDMGGDAAQRKRFLLDATQGLAVDAVVELVQAAAETSRQTVSHSLVRLLNKLAVHAEQGPAPVRVAADAALRDHVARLIGDWSLDDPNPDAYRAALEGMARAQPVFAPRDDETEAEPSRLVAMGLELGVLGDPVWRSVDQLLARDEAAALLDLLDRAGDDTPITEMLWRHIAAGGALQQVLVDPRVGNTLRTHAARRLGLAAAEPLLDAIEGAADAAERARALELLVTLGPDVAAAVARRLPVVSHALQRELLAALVRFPALPDEIDLEPFVSHPDAGVRREAMRLRLRVPALRDRAICEALADPDERAVMLAMGAAQERCPRAAVPILVRRVDAGDLPPALRTLAVGLVAGAAVPDTLPWLLRFVVVKRRFRRRRLAPKSPEMLAALGGLAARWRGQSAAASVVALAEGSGDAEIRAAVQPRGHP